MAKPSTTKKSSRKKTRSSKKVSKHYPVQRKIRPEETTAGAVAHVIRSDKLLSNVNHRLYRQSRVYSVKVGIEPDYDNLASQAVNVYVLADTWMNQKAYQMAKKQFDENSKEELGQLKTSKARWNDFRVDHGFPIGVANFSDTKAYQFEPNGGIPNNDKQFLSEGEYEITQVSDVSGTAMTMRWTGTSASSFNIIDEYDLTGNTDYSPTFAQTSVAYDGLTDELDDNQMEHLSSDGNLPPYSNQTLPNACWVLAATLRAGGPETARMSTGFINAPCGLIIIEGSSVVMDGVTLEYKSGDYKGVHAPSYLE
jgi:hypothetical protein